ncbi:MAG: hypothetical protein GY792_11905 [Gammaproteobacteria bacterium]|nr:hypothetical protein [Gammaproteobacteria bacterium]
MNLTLDIARYPLQSITRSASRAVDVSTHSEAPQQSSTTAPIQLSPVPDVSLDLANRAQQLQRQRLFNDRAPAQSQQAIRSYNSVKDIEERARVSKLLGLNEYA